MARHAARPVVVGLTGAQAESVLGAALDLAADLRTSLVAVWVDEGRVRLPPDAQGVVVTVPVDPDAGDPGTTAPAVLADAAARGAAAGVTVSTVVGAGAPAAELARVAEEADARLVVIGARRTGMTGWMHHLVGGTVAGHLAHDQARPVVVVPQDAASAPEGA
ncbi:universal stress protein [Oerskovia flava]|uniref:universal stress protein n=1 Tax=Oerskovia flava TaxID=2986422 RepID=UPI00223F5ACB|nr:universal stress protein [Oerskovia sp. JB1-3-2]